MRRIIVLLCILILVLVGCQQQADKTKLEGAFIGGIEGLSIAFMEGAPPTDVYDQGKFPFAINLQIENKGEWDINSTQTVVEITGIDPADFNNAALKKNVGQALFAKRNDLGTIIPGTIVTVPFEGLSYTKKIAGDSTFNIRAGVCYDYGTKATTKVCIKQDMLGIGQTGCNVNEAKPVSNSGSPVAIQEVKESAIASNKLSLTFKIKHLGTGAIHKKGTACSNEFENKDKVYLVVNSGVTPGPECSGLADANGNPVTASEGYVSLFNGERIITCSQQIAIPGNFEKYIDFTMQYDYSQYIDTQLVVKHVG